jgi:PhzF family phenazine biosynthesis protein
MELAINIVDAFTDVIFKGNSAAVIMTDQWLKAEKMQSIAIENNLSETAFVKIIDHQHYEIRWFSPITEIDFCGHATLAASFVIFAKNNALKKINFFAKAVGDLSVKKMASGYIQMNFPNMKPRVVNDIPLSLINALSINPVQILLNDQAYFAVYEQEDDVHNVIANNEMIKQLAPFDVVITAKAKSNEYDPLFLTCKWR